MAKVTPNQAIAGVTEVSCAACKALLINLLDGYS